jgi:hypothetical protein
MIRWAILLRPRSLQCTHVGAGLLTRLSIDYASRPRLRSRLTHGGFSWPWKPWAFGEGDSHPFYRYSWQHTHF